MADRKDWIITTYNSDDHGIYLTRFYGSEGEVKELLLSFVKDDRLYNDDFNYGTEDLESISSIDSDRFWAYSVFWGYCIDYVAQEFSTIGVVK